MNNLDDGKILLRDTPWGQTRLGIDELTSSATGEGITVAVIDTGVNTHRWLKNLTGGGDYVEPSKSGLEDCDGHGTEVAGIIAADPDVRRRLQRGRPGSEDPVDPPDQPVLRVPDPNGDEIPAGNVETLAQAIRNAAELDEVDVINISIDNCRRAIGGIRQDERDLQRTLRYAVVEQNKVVVASAGNHNGAGRCLPGPSERPRPAKPHLDRDPAVVLRGRPVRRRGATGRFPRLVQRARSMGERGGTGHGHHLA